MHHDFPLPQHKHARRAAILAAAADRLGKYDEVADALFRQQETWSKAGGVDAVVDSVLTPEERKKLREIAKDPAILANIERDIQLGQRMKVSSTPTMIVTHDGKPNPVVGVVSYAGLQQIPEHASSDSDSARHAGAAAAARRGVRLRRVHEAAAVVAAVRAFDRLVSAAAGMGGVRASRERCPWLELALGVLLIAGVWLRYLSIVAAAILACFFP